MKFFNDIKFLRTISELEDWKRWILFLPSAILAFIVVFLISYILDSLTLSRGIDTPLGLLADFAAGWIFVAIGGYIAPRIYVSKVLMVLFVGFQLFGAISAIILIVTGNGSWNFVYDMLRCIAQGLGAYVAFYQSKELQTP